MATSQAAKRRALAKKKAAKKRKKILLLIVEFFVLALLVVIVYGVTKAEKVTKVKIDEEEIVSKMNESVAENETLKGYKNIALFGVDSREGGLGQGTRSDTIIIASINYDTGDIRLCSVYRDTYLNLGNDSYNKCNAAYAKGGPEQAINMLNMNLDMNITDYVTVGFTGLIETIDALGGVYIDVAENEIVHLNNYQISMVGKTTDNKTFTATEGVDYTAIKEPGYQLLNGLQATAYCRIRYVGNDFGRAERQRKVLAAVMDVCKKSDPAKLNSVLNAALPNVATSLGIDEMTSMLGDIAKYNITASDGFPFESNRDTGNVGSKGSCVIPVNLEENVVLFHKFMFDEENYEVSPQIKQYSQKVSSDTGR